jgi:hypothetical protein
MVNTDNVYILDIRRNGESAGRAKVDTKLSLGTSDDCDVVFPDLKAKMNPTHLTFKLANQILSLYVLGDKSPTTLDDIALKSGKMFVLDHNDSLKIAGLEIIIRKVSRKEADELVSGPPGENTIIRLIDQNLDKEFGSAEDKANRKLDEIKRRNQENKLQAKEKQGEKKLAKEFEMEINLTDENATKTKTKLQANKESTRVGLWQNLLNFFRAKSTVHATKSQDSKTEKKLSSKNPPAKKSQNKVKAKSSKINIAGNFNYGLFKRIYAILIHFALFYLIFYYLEPRYQLLNQLSPIISLIEPVYTKITLAIPYSALSNPEIVSAAQELVSWKNVHHLVTYILIDIFFHLLLGASLPQLLMGISTRESAGKKRIIALFRALLNYTFLPFLIFHAPLLLRKRPLHELLTLSFLDNTGSKLRLLGPFILCPLVVAICLFGPSLTKPMIYQELLITDWEKPKMEKSLTGKKSLERSGSIKPLDAYIDTTLYQEIIPLPLMNQDNLSFIFIDLESQEVLEVERLKKFDLQLLQNNLEQGFPFVKKVFPQTFALQNVDIIQQQNELEKILYHSANLSIHNFHLSLPVFGTFLSGPLNVRSQILDTLPLKKFEHLSKVQIVDEQFLLFHERNQDCYFPLMPTNKQGFCVKDIENSRELYAYFIKNILEKLKFKEMPRSSSDDFDIINISSPKEFETQLSELEVFYESLARRILDLKKDKLEKTLLLSLESCIQFGKKNKLEVFKLEQLKDKIMGHNL